MSIKKFYLPILENIGMDRESFEIEFIFKASPAMLYNFLSASERLVMWFCDEVDIEKDRYDFYWEGSKESAILVESIEESKLVFKWVDADSEDEYLEFDMYKSPITNETILKITDFADSDEVDDQIALWESQIEELRKVIGG